MELQSIQNAHRMNKEEYDGQKQALQEQLQREVCQCHKPLCPAEYLVTVFI